MSFVFCIRTVFLKSSETRSKLVQRKHTAVETIQINTTQCLFYQSPCYIFNQKASDQKFKALGGTSLILPRRRHATGQNMVFGLRPEQGI